MKSKLLNVYTRLHVAAILISMIVTCPVFEGHLPAGVIPLTAIIGLLPYIFLL